MKKFYKIYECLIYSLPAALLFSFHPVIGFGTNGSINFEFSIALIWLVIFDIFSFIILAREKLWQKLFCKKNILWVLLPVYISLSIFWTPNKLRGILIAGVLWLVYFAVFAIFNLAGKVLSEKSFKEKFYKAIFGSAIFVCIVLVLQCVLDVLGVSREVTLLCQGCTYKSFGFPHPNGFAIEPQFMGNILLIPTLVSVEILITACPSGTLRAAQAKSLLPGEHIVIKISTLFIFAFGLFLTMSRGAIYAFLIGATILVIWKNVKTKKWLRSLRAFGVIILAFLFTLNLQGILAQASRTDDTYFTGISKVVNQLTLGKIDLREWGKDAEKGADEGNGGEAKIETEVVDEVKEEKESSTFSGYVEVSTEGRLALSGAALEVWGRDFGTIMLGFGLGGTGETLYQTGLYPTPGEIAQSEYIAIISELGLVGVLLVILTIILIVREMMRKEGRELLITLLVVFMVSAGFFSGLTNVLHMYLMTAMLMVL